MASFLRTLWVLVFSALYGAQAYATGFEAALDRYEITIPMDPPAVLHATLRNNGSTPIYMTGVKVLLSEGARGDVYNPALLHERLLKLDPGHSWDGPLVVVRPNHRGPLWVKGSIRLTGGKNPNSVDPLASIPLQLAIDDPRREPDGSYDRGTVPVCSRSVDHCCDLSEISCIQILERCIYVAEGYDRQQVCINQQADKSYEHIADLRVSSDASHIAYLASFQCQSAGADELCKRTVVVDHIERPSPARNNFRLNLDWKGKGPGVATHLELSPDGRHFAYVAREACFLHLGEERCSGASDPVVDGVKAGELPVWYHGRE